MKPRPIRALQRLIPLARNPISFIAAAVKDGTITTLEGFELVTHLQVEINQEADAFLREANQKDS